MSRRVTYFNSSFVSALTWAGVFGANYYDHWRAWDAGSLTLTGALVDSASSLTGSGRNMVSTGGNRPTLTASGVLGKNVFLFDGISDNMIVSGSTNAYNFLHNGDGGAVITIYKVVPANANNLYPVITNTGSSTVHVGFYIAYDDRSSISRDDRLFSSVTNGNAGQLVSQLLSSNNYILPQQFNSEVMTFDGDNGTLADRQTSILNNDTPLNTNTDNATLSISSASYNLTIGSLATNAFYSNIEVSEIIIIDRILTAQDKLDIQTILSQDYGAFPIS